MTAMLPFLLSSIKLSNSRTMGWKRRNFSCTRVSYLRCALEALPKAGIRCCCGVDLTSAETRCYAHRKGDKKRSLTVYFYSLLLALSSISLFLTYSLPLSTPSNRLATSPNPPSPRFTHISTHPSRLAASAFSLLHPSSFSLSM